MPVEHLQIGRTLLNGNPDFIQQGQVDWVAFANTVWSATTATLQRFSAAGIQPPTLGGGLALASRFRLDSLGKRRVYEAIQGLQCHLAYSNALWFGFGYRSFINVMSDSQLGLNCIALCALLAESHTIDMSAWVLEELWHKHQYPETYEPSHAQFVALVKACAGAFAKTTFSQTVDIMIGSTLWDNNITPSSAGTSAYAEGIADALHGLFQITQGVVEEVSISGNHECAFLASFGYWLLNLKVRVEDPNGHLIFDGTPEGHATQVHVRYDLAQGDKPMQLTKTTYVLRGGADILLRNSKPEDALLFVKTPWDGCLLRVFGASFESLMKMPRTVASFLGSTARIYAALAGGETNVAGLTRADFCDFAETSHGRGFVHSVRHIFPELGRIEGLFETMLNAADQAVDQAVHELESAVQGLRNACDCGGCKETKDARIHSCYTVMVFTIRKLVQILSPVGWDQELNPTIHGLQCIYRQMETVKGGCARFHDVVGLTPPNINEHLSMVALVFNGFYGMHPSEWNSKPTTTALVQSGICTYIRGLRQPTANGDDARRIYALPGHIQRGDRKFERICDSEWDSPSIEPISALVPVSGTDSYSTPIDDDPIEIKPLVTETPNEQNLAFSYRLTVKGKNMLIRPGELAYKVLLRSGLVACTGVGCSRSLALPCSVVTKGCAWSPNASSLLKEVGYESGLSCCIWSGRSEIVRCTAVGLHSWTDHDAIEGAKRECLSKVYIRRHECLACCTKTILRESSDILGKTSITMDVHII